MNKYLFLTLVLVCASLEIQAQVIPEQFNGVTYRGANEEVARGILDGNLIETNYRNHGEFSRWNDIPWGVWPRGIGGRHIDGVAVVIAGLVPGERTDYPGFYGPVRDTTLNPVSINYREAGKRANPATGELWGWLPLPGFHNPDRIDPVTGLLTPVPALSDDQTSWPDFWPDRIDEEVFGWAGSWNGLFGRGVLNADLESFYVMDDFSDAEYSLDDNGVPRSELGVYYPDSQDSTIGGLGLQMQVRILQWANILAEDTMFLLYRITNKSDFNHDRLYFVQLVDYGLGNEENDDNASYDPLLDTVFGWDSNGIGTPTTGGGNYELGYTGFAFLESPANDENNIDDDLDGIVDESRFDGNYTKIEGQDNILAEVTSRYNVVNFENFNGPITERPAYEAGVWFTSDENLDWVTFSDNNGNGIKEEGEQLNNDVGRDGLGLFDLAYVEPDEGEGDGIPTQGEPNYNELDVDESDQIGLRGFDLDTRPFYEQGDNLRDDTWLFERIADSEFASGSIEIFNDVVDNEPFVLFMSGQVKLDPGETDFFSTAWIFGDDETDFFKNRRTVQNIYNADYNFAQPPVVPTLKAEPLDNQVVLSWDNKSVDSFDRFTQEFDFEGYKLFKGTNNLLSDARTITDVNGSPTFYNPIAQFDLDNGIEGNIPVLENTASYNLGSDNGLSFYYVDNNVSNGKRYYYAVVAYDRGLKNEDGTYELDPQENVFNISIDIAGNVTGTSINAAAVTPRTPPAGFIAGGSTVDLSKVTSGEATGSASLNVVVDTEINRDNLYRVNFYDSTSTKGDFYVTTHYDMVEMTSLDTLIVKSPIVESTEVIDGFLLNFENDDPASIIASKTGYVSNEGSENELYNEDPRELDGISTDWLINIAKNSSGAHVNSNYDYELVFTNPSDSVYTPPRILGGSFSRIDIPVFATNLSLGTQADIFVLDTDDDGTLTVGDELYIADKNGRQYNQRYVVEILTGNTPPSPGDKIRISSTRSFKEGDYFQFGVVPTAVDTEIAKSEMDDIFVAPNPYIATASWEQRASSLSVGRGERKIIFFNLPQTCTIRIFNIRGELINTIEHSGSVTDGSASWDLKSSNNEDVAYGVYFYHVEAKGVGNFKGKFAIIK